MKKKLRLLLFEECNRNCEGCCNKQFELENLPVIKSDKEFKNYKEIMLTGGEPMLRPDIVLDVIDRIMGRYPPIPIILYTADVRDYRIYEIIKLIDGLTLTLHDQYDVVYFERFLLSLKRMSPWHPGFLSKRLNVFKGIELSKIVLENIEQWTIKKDIVWLENCPLPQDEVFMRLPKRNSQFL